MYECTYLGTFAPFYTPSHLADKLAHDFSRFAHPTHIHRKYRGASSHKLSSSTVAAS